jgi:hypothetical protein
MELQNQLAKHAAETDLLVAQADKARVETRWYRVGVLVAALGALVALINALPTNSSEEVKRWTKQVDALRAERDALAKDNKELSSQLMRVTESASQAAAQRELAEKLAKDAVVRAESADQEASDVARRCFRLIGAEASRNLGLQFAADAQQAPAREAARISKKR